MKLIVLNLPRNLTETELASLFKAHGNVTSCNLVMDLVTGISKGFGFVEMDQELAAQNAISQLNGSKIQSNKIRVKTAS